MKTTPRVAETGTVSGTGSISLQGALTANRTFSSVYANGDTVGYSISGKSSGGATSNEWELGQGTYDSSTDSISRDTVLYSSNNNALVNFSIPTVIVMNSGGSPSTQNYGGSLYLPNSGVGGPATSGEGLYIKDAGGTPRLTLYVASGDALRLTNNIGSSSATYLDISTGQSVQIYNLSTSTAVLTVNDSGLITANGFRNSSNTVFTGGHGSVYQTTGASTSNPQVNVRLNSSIPTQFIQSFWDGANQSNFLVSNYNGGAPTLESYKNTLDDGSGNMAINGSLSQYGSVDVLFNDPAGNVSNWFWKTGGNLYIGSSVAVPQFRSNVAMQAHNISGINQLYNNSGTTRYPVIFVQSGTPTATATGDLWIY